MASLFGMLLDTMPFAAAAQALYEKYGRRFDECEAHEVKELVTLLPPGASFDVDLPDVNPDLSTEQQPLWAFSHGGSDPAAVRSIYCRVHDADYVGHLVAEKVEWGLEDPVDCFQKAARLTFASGGQVLLPLTPDYVLWKWQIHGGCIAEDQTRLWRLKSLLDSSLVVVFAYDFDPATGELKRMDPDTIVDPKLRDEVKKALDAAKELMGDSVKLGQGGAEGADGGTNPPDQPEDEPELSQPGAEHSGSSFPTVPPPATATDDAKEPWGKTVTRGDLWPNTIEIGAAGSVPLKGGVGGQVGTVSELATEPARLLVVFSFTTCRQRADFEAGGMVGFARCYPHLLVSATVPIKKIEASAHVDRPRHLAKWKESDRDMGASCCRPGHDGWSDEIRGLIVADANSDPSLLTISSVTPPLPFWSNMFAYDIVDPYRAVRSEKFHVIRTDRPNRRVSNTPLIYRHVVAAPDTDVGDSLDFVEKEAHQGEFDNVHIAPRLKLLRVSEVVVQNSWKVSFSVSDRKKWKLDEIAMAPFCAHDCLHMHWRWPRFATAKWTKGWSSGGPYSTIGAPMVPVGQDVWVWFRADQRLTYHVAAPPTLFPTNWTVLMHHGFGYAVAIEAWLRTAFAMLAVGSLSSYSFGDGTQSVLPTDSTAAYYWMARYDVKVEDGEAEPVERLRWDSDDELREARDL